MELGKDREAMIRILEALVDALPRLLDSQDLTRTVVVKARDEVYRPSMSIGLLLDQLYRLEHLDLAPSEAARVAACRQSLLEASAAEGYAAHLQREMRSSLDAWRWFVDACVDGDDSCGDDFVVATERRLRLALLRQEAGRIGLELPEQPLKRLDLAFEAATRAGTSTDAALSMTEAAYPAADFPWPHRRPC